MASLYIYWQVNAHVFFKLKYLRIVCIIFIRCTVKLTFRSTTDFLMGFPGSSAGKESACNAGDPGSIPGLERSPGEGIGYPLQYSWASLVTQTVKNLPAMWETQV